MSVDVLGYLQSKAVGAVKRAGGDEVNLACFFCDEPEGKRGRLYVNVDPGADIPGLYHCKLCDARGSLTTLKRHFGDATNEKEDRSWQRQQILTASAAFYHENLDDHLEVVRWLRHERGLEPVTIAGHQLGWADGHLRSHLEALGFQVSDMVATGLVTKEGRDFLRDNVTIPYHVAGNVVMIRGKQIGGKYLTPPGQKGRLFNSDAIWDATDVVATEGEFDAMVIEQFGYATVGVAGANTWQDGWDAYFADTRRLYLVFDPDEAGRRGADKIHLRLAPRTRVVDLPLPEGADAKLVDPSYLVVSGKLTAEIFAALLVEAKGSQLVTVDDAIAEYEAMALLTGIKLGVPELDAVIVPGLLPSQVMILLARSGVGKTIWLLNMFQRMTMEQEKLKIFFVSLEQTRGEWWDRARRIHRFYHLDSNERGAADYWRNRLLINDRNRMNEETLIRLIDEYTYELGKPDVVAIDYLGYWAQSFGGERYERVSNAVMALKAIAKELRVVIIAPHQVSRGAEPGMEPSPDDARDSGVILETSDFMLTLWNPDTRVGGAVADRKGEIHSRVAKSRHGGVGTLFKYQFAPINLAMIPMADPLFARAATEFHWRREEDLAMEAGAIPQRLIWQDAIDMHAEADAMAGAGRRPYPEGDF